MNTTINMSGSEQQRPTKRVRVPTQTYAADQLAREEEKLLAQAIANSKKDVQAREPLTTIPFGPVFYPTVEEFSGDPLEYLETIRPLAEKYGEILFYDFALPHTNFSRCILGYPSRP